MRALNEQPTALNDWVAAIPIWNGDPDEEDYIIFEGETPVGWIGVNGLLEKTAYLKMAALLPEYQGKGIGSLAIQQIVEGLKSKGYASVVLYTNQSNLRAQKCYAKCGFEVAGKLHEEMSDGSLQARYRMEIHF